MRKLALVLCIFLTAAFYPGSCYGCEKENSKEVIVHPFIGPHYTVGDDRIVLETGAFGFIRIVEYQHLKTYELPWNWKHIVK